MECTGRRHSVSDRSGQVSPQAAVECEAGSPVYLSPTIAPQRGSNVHLCIVGVVRSANGVQKRFKEAVTDDKAGVAADGVGECRDTSWPASCSVGHVLPQRSPTCRRRGVFSEPPVATSTGFST